MTVTGNWLSSITVDFVSTLFKYESTYGLPPIIAKHCKPFHYTYICARSSMDIYMYSKVPI